MSHIAIGLSAWWRATFAQLSLHRSSSATAAGTGTVSILACECATVGFHSATGRGYDGLCAAQSNGRSTSPPSTAATESGNELNQTHKQTNPYSLPEQLAFSCSNKSNQIQIQIQIQINQSIGSNCTCTCTVQFQTVPLPPTPAQLQSCYDARSRPGSCQTLTSCLQLLEEQQQQQQQHQSMEFQTFLGQSICGFDGASYLVKQEREGERDGWLPYAVLLSRFAVPSSVQRWLVAVPRIMHHHRRGNCSLLHWLQVQAPHSSRPLLCSSQRHQQIRLSWLSCLWCQCLPVYCRLLLPRPLSQLAVALVLPPVIAWWAACQRVKVSQVSPPPIKCHLPNPPSCCRRLSLDGRTGLLR